MKTKTETGAKSQLNIINADREDSGIYTCLAENLYGRSEHVIYLAVQERPDPPGSLEVIEVTSRSVKLAWRKPFDGNSPIAGYVVQYQQLGNKQRDWDQPMVQNLSLGAITLQNA